jgi:hypothetical protein
MSIEEPMTDAMRILRGVAVLVMETMIPNPVIDGSLVCGTVCEHEKHPNRERRSIRPM